MSAAGSPGRATLRAWGRRGGVAVAALYLAYLLIGNALLNSALGRDFANRRPEKFVAGWSSAWTLYPGHVIARELKLAGHVRRTVWSAQADVASGRIALLPLFWKVIQVPSVHATGVTGGISLIDVAREPGAARPDGWTLSFPRVVAGNIRYAYFNDLLLQGRGEARTGFVKVMRGGAMEVLRSQLRFEKSVAWLGDTRLAWDATLGVDFSIDRHLRAEAPGIRKLEKTVTEVDFDAKTGGLAIGARGGQKPGLHVTAGPGAIRGHLGWQRGSLTPGDRLELAVPLEENFGGTLQTTPASLLLFVDDHGIEIDGKLSPRYHKSVEVDADFTVDGRDLPLGDLASVKPRSSGHLAFRWQFDSLSWMAALLPTSKLMSFDGAGTVLAEFRIRQGRLEAGSFLEAPRVAATATALGNRFTGDAHARITFEEDGPERLRPHLKAAMDRFSVAPSQAPDTPYVHGRNLRIDATSSGERAQLRDRIEGRLWFEDAELPDIRVYNRYLPKTSLQFTGGSGRVSADLRFDRKDAVASGDFQVVGRGVGIGLLDLTLLGDVEISSRLRRADLDTHAFNADGSRAVLRAVRVNRGEEVLGSDWWVDLNLPEARVDWDQPLKLDAGISARMKDASVLIAVYSRRKDLPRWVDNILDAGEVRADGRLQWQKSTLLLDPFAARNDRFDMAARLELEDKRPTGDLLATWGLLDVGVELKGADKDFHLVNARKWFDGQPPLSSR